MKNERRWLVKFDDGREIVVQAATIRLADRFAEAFYGADGRRIVGIHERPDLAPTCDAELLGRKAGRG